MADSPNLTTRVMRGGAWIYGRLIVTSLIHLAAMAILARQLCPAEFGLVALAGVIMRLLVVLGEGGINHYVVYDNEEGRSERVHGAFWLDAVLSSTVAITGLLLIPIAVLIYPEEWLAPILTLLIVRFPMDSLSHVPDALLKKRLSFTPLAIRDGILDLISGTTAVLMAVSGLGLWSLVVPGVIIAPMRFIWGMAQAAWFPKFHFYINHWRRIFRYSSNIIGGNLTTFILNEGDTFLVGKLLGNAALGIYNFAWHTANLINRNVSSVATYVALPALASVNNDLEKMRSAWNRMSALISSMTFPLLIGLFVVADEFILVLYGSKWEKVVLPLRIFIIYALRHTVSTSASSVYKAVGRPDLGFKLGLTIVPFYLLSIWVGSSYGIVGVAAGVTTVRTIFGWLGFILVARCLKTTTWKVIEPLFPALAASCLMGAAVFFLKLIPVVYPGETALSRVAMLTIEITAGGVFYLILLRNVFRGMARNIVREAEPLFGKSTTYFRSVLNVN